MAREKVRTYYRKAIRPKPHKKHSEASQEAPGVSTGAISKPQPKAKAKRRKEIENLVSSKEQQLSDRELKKSVAALDDRTDERYEYAMAIFNAQNNATKEVIEHMVDRIRAMTGEPRLYYNNAPINYGDDETVKRMHEKSYYWIAIRLLVALAKWDVKVADFSLPKNACADCGKYVGGVQVMEK